MGKWISSALELQGVAVVSQLSVVGIHLPVAVPVAFARAALVLALGAIIASWITAHAATRVNPPEAMQADSQ
ncbi:hypothetical protein [Luteitalea pratensis]|uniref:hypothetical protein n=1 Tax=Luteitalea pratensis TaxID=1855912 RepID=UPI000D72A7A2|nr:hypothetical protein [Luteitalea pratensis]